ncbi:hypothetical protein Q8A67_000145 [Cirrhinus molitorella]|uniref:non-specific serine/threonine protein kinase n=1 Tax=Cirrhinus molitorella TaxID=172907 RepID=A0AA88Q987_9TELE|nr:hypothetical protein Q8A67_000145 [Cirrhinus molitorella]
MDPTLFTGENTTRRCKHQSNLASRNEIEQEADLDVLPGSVSFVSETAASDTEPEPEIDLPQGSVVSLFEVGHLITSGKFSKVYKGLHIFSEKVKVGIKCIPKRRADRYLDIAGHAKPVLAEVALMLSRNEIEQEADLDVLPGSVSFVSETAASDTEPEPEIDLPQGSVVSLFEVGHLITSGKFSKVYKGLHIFSEKVKVGIKCIPKRRADRYLDIAGHAKPVLAEVALMLSRNEIEQEADLDVLPGSVSFVSETAASDTEPEPEIDLPQGSVVSLFEVGHLITSGKFSKVYKGLHIFSEKVKVGIKCIPKRRADRYLDIAGHAKPVLAEVALMLSLLSKESILDPHFKMLGFISPQKADEAVKSISSEGAMLVLEGQAQASPSTSSASSTLNEIWQDFDTWVR